MSAANPWWEANLKSEHRGANVMSGEKDQITGRVKEAVGILTDDQKLKNEGKADQKVGAIKHAVGKVVDKARDAIKRKVT
jgi:uncharacterized protein YjbJ (UPF0337 family)